MNAVEMHVVDALSRGEVAWFDQTQPPESRTLDARFVRAVMLGLGLPAAPGASSSKAQLTAAGVRIHGAIIRGRLDLSDCVGVDGQGLPPLALHDCMLLGDGVPDAGAPDVLTALDVSRARLNHLSLKGSRLSHLAGRECLIEGGLDLSRLRPVNDTIVVWPGASPDDWRGWINDLSHALHTGTSQQVKALESRRPTSPTPVEPSRDPRDHCWLDLSGSHIGGTIDVTECQLRVPPKRVRDSTHFNRFALNFADCEVLGSLYSKHEHGPAVIEGGVNLRAALLHGDVWLMDSWLIGIESDAFVAQSARVSGHVSLSGARIWSGIWSVGARIASLDLDDAWLDRGTGEYSISFSMIEVDGSFRANMAAANGTLHCPGLKAINLELMGLRVCGPKVNFSPLKSDHGAAIVFSHAKVAGSVDLTKSTVIGCTFMNEMSAESLRISGSFAEGSVPPVLNAQTFWHRARPVLRAENLALSRDLSITGRFGGEVCMRGLDVGQTASVVNATFALQGPAITLKEAEIAGALVLSNNTFGLGSVVSLEDSKFRTLDDDASAYGLARIQLSGAVYERLAKPALGGDCAAQRDQMILRDRSSDPTHFDPQPHHQLARVLASQGLMDDARSVRIRLEKHMLAGRKARLKRDMQNGRPLRLSIAVALVLMAWGVLLGSVHPAIKVAAGLTALTAATALWRMRAAPWAGVRAAGAALVYFGATLFGRLYGFGLSPSRASATLLAATLSGWLFFGWANYRGAMVIDQQPVASASQGERMGAIRSDLELAEDIPCRQSIRPSLYALDVFIPLIDLRQESKCEIGAARGVKRGVELFQGVPLAEWRWLSEVEVYRYLKAFYAIAGWVLLSLAILTFSGVMQRRDQT